MIKDDIFAKINFLYKHAELVKGDNWFIHFKFASCQHPATVEILKDHVEIAVLIGNENDVKKKEGKYIENDMGEIYITRTLSLDFTYSQFVNAMHDIQQQANDLKKRKNA